jgi:hypothetical protein
LTQSYKREFAGLITEREGKVVEWGDLRLPMDQASNRRLSFGNVVKVGNSLQMRVEDLVVVIVNSRVHLAA